MWAAVVRMNILIVHKVTVIDLQIVIVISIKINPTNPSNTPLVQSLYPEVHIMFHSSILHTSRTPSPPLDTIPPLITRRIMRALPIITVINPAGRTFSKVTKVPYITTLHSRTTLRSIVTSSNALVLNPREQQDLVGLLIIYQYVVTVINQGI